MSEILFTALGVNADTLEVVTRGSRQQPKIRTTKNRKITKGERTAIVAEVFFGQATHVYRPKREKPQT